MEQSGNPVPPQAHLLVVDDDPAVREMLRRYLLAQHFQVSLAADAGSALAIVQQQHVDVLLLDIGLPDEDGVSLTRHLRTCWQGAIIVVSARCESAQRVVALEVGADDFLSKPFDPRELLARIRSVLRRVPRPGHPVPAAPTCYVFSDFRFDTGTRRLVRGSGEEIMLTGSEFELLRALVESPGRPLTRHQLLKRLHGRTLGPFDRSVDIQVSRLRRKIEPEPSRPALIRSVRGVGYVLAASIA